MRSLSWIHWVAGLQFEASALASGYHISISEISTTSFCLDQGPFGIVTFLNHELYVLNLLHSLAASAKLLPHCTLGESCKRHRFLRGLINNKGKKKKKLQENGHSIVLRWIPGHSGLIWNGKADLAARNRAERGGHQAERWSSQVYIKKNLNHAWSNELTGWHEIYKEEKSAVVVFTSLGQGLASTRYLETPQKKYASRYYQLKVGHGAVGTFLARIGVIETPQCWWCKEPAQSVEHIYTKCRRWRKKRRKVVL